MSSRLITEKEVLPCPFCGARGQLKEWTTTPQGSIYPSVSYGIQCVGCYAKIYMRDTKEVAMSAWNSRAA